MLELSLIIILSITFLHHYTTADGCSPLPTSYFQWINPDGTLVLPQSLEGGGVVNQNEEDYGCCGPSCTEQWRPLHDTPNCQFCSSNKSLVCHGSNVYNVPSPATLPSTTLSLFKMSGVGLISLPPKSFVGLSIGTLVIENSNLTYVASDTFTGVKSIKSLYFKNNTLDYLPQADFLFRNTQDLKFLSLEYNGLKVLSSIGTANMHNLAYFSLAGNPLYTMDVFFLQNSNLTFLDLKDVTFKLRNMDIKGTGLSKLPSSLNTVDLSRAKISIGAIEKIMEQLEGKNITTLALSYLQTYSRLFWALRPIRSSLQYLSLEGTDLSDIFSSESKEKHTLNSISFENLKELNMKNCNISTFGTGEIFKAFPNLTALSLADNPLNAIDLTFFVHLSKLTFLDFSDNIIYDIYRSEDSVSQALQAIDLSYVFFQLTEEESNSFFNAMPNLKTVSLCDTTMDCYQINALQNLMDLKYLDLSYTITDSILISAYNDLFLNKSLSLTELHFAQNNFKLSTDYPSFFSQLTALETLDISNNLIRELSEDMFAPKLQNLNASQNLITTWYFSVLKNESQLQFLDVSNNQITYVSDAMIEDFYKLNSLSLDSNPLICHNKVVALVCLNIKNNTQNMSNDTQIIKNYDQRIKNDSETMKNNSQSLNLVNWQQYRCYDLFLNGYRQFAEEKDCNEYYEEVSTTQNSEELTTKHGHQLSTTEVTEPASWKTRSALNWEWTYLIVGPIVLISMLGSLVYLKWWNIRCYFHRYYSLKKARLLRKNGNLLPRPEVYYDVFVSYTDVDRSWVLDYLVPNLEGDGDISLCFHERDFQVGMSILENIIDCMDRSHALLLVVSSAFIHSKWCQFEMHLAQYRLVETFRDQLVLVLLEDIPRKARPQTLHHLMMTKTYLMWPQQPFKDDAVELFWKRLKRALRPNYNYMLNV